MSVEELEEDKEKERDTCSSVLVPVASVRIGPRTEIRSLSDLIFSLFLIVENGNMRIV